MSTILDICNSALIKLGAEPIESMGEASKGAKLCSAQYPKIKARVLKNHPWKFAIKRDTISANGSTPLYEYEQEFDLPADHIRLLDIDNSRILKFQVEGTKILANVEELNIKYVYDVDEADMPEDFAEIISYALAADICFALLQDSNYKEMIIAEYEEYLRQARSWNAMQGTPQDLVDDDWLLRRY